MVERFDNLDASEQFGLSPTKQSEKSIVKHIDLSEVESDPISSPGYTLDSLMSGSVYTATTAILPVASASTELSLNYEQAQDLAFFGSVYTRVSIAIDRVKDGYPNGILIDQVITGNP